MQWKLDYPSQRGGPQPPYSPMLLDTSVVQHLKFLMERLDGDAQELETEVVRRARGQLAEEMFALANVVTVMQGNGPPWVVSEISLVEFARLSDAKGAALSAWWREWATYFDGCVKEGWYPDLDVEQLTVGRGPDVAAEQLALPLDPPVSPLASVPAFAPFPHPGDRALIRVALRAGIRTILTTDIRSFWRHRHLLYPLGIEVWRPTDLWATVCHERGVEVARWRALAKATERGRAAS